MREEEEKKKKKEEKKKRMRSNGSWVPAMGLCGVISSIFLVFLCYPLIIKHENHVYGLRFV
jgi:hypothetical protein